MSYEMITQLSREAIMNAYFKKTTFTGGDTYLSFYETSDPQYEVTSISRKIVPASGWTVSWVDSSTTRIYNNSVITFGPLSADVSMNGYLITNAITGPVFDFDETLNLTELSTGIMAVKFPGLYAFAALAGTTLKVPAQSIMIDLSMEDPG